MDGNSSNELWAEENEKAKRINFNCSQETRNSTQGISEFLLIEILHSGKTINNNSATFLRLMHSLCAIFVLRFSFLFSLLHLLSLPFLSPSSHRCCAQWSFRKKYKISMKLKYCYACKTAKHSRKSPKPSRCNFACHAIQIRRCNEENNKNELQTATKIRRRKTTKTQKKYKNKIKKTKKTENCSKSCSDKFSSFVLCISYIITWISNSPRFQKLCKRWELQTTKMRL